MDALRFSPAADLSLAALAEAFNAAFEGYFVPMHHTEDTFGSMVRSNDIRLNDSLIARTDSGELVGVGLLAVRGLRGWVGGMAIVPAYRGQGSGADLLTELIGRARELGLHALHLEVLDQNASARRLYTRLGFVETRQLVVYTGAVSAPAELASATEPTAITVAEALAQFDRFHTTLPPWQREEASLQHMAPTLSGLCLRDADGVRSSLLFMPSGGGYGLLDFGSRATTPDEREAEALSLITHLTSPDPSATLRAINVPPGDALGDALTTLQCPVVATQREMRFDLR